MTQIVLVGIGAGAAAAVLFASVVSGSLLSVFLFYLAPLPIMIAAMGWSQWSGLIGALVAPVALGAALGPFFFLVFLVMVGLPAWWLSYLALLARPSPTGGDLEWYPVGRLVVWAALLGALVVAAAVLNLGADADNIESGLRRALERILRAQTRLPPDAPLVLPGVKNTERLVAFLAEIVPPAAAVLATVTSALNLWLAGRIVVVSGRLRRPWPDISAMTFPGATLLLLAAAVVGTFFSGVLGLMSMMLAASLLMAYALLGFAVLHAITQGTGNRRMILAGVYLAVAVFGWPALIMTLLGLGDATIDIRGRIGRSRSPPTSPT